MKVRVTDQGVFLDDQWVPATQVHLDMDAEGRAFMQIVVNLSASNVQVDLRDAHVKVINTENPRERAAT